MELHHVLASRFLHVSYHALVNWTVWIQEHADLAGLGTQLAQYRMPLGNHF
jgi:hypothetical protein